MNSGTYRLIGPRDQTPASGARVHGGRKRLPDDLVAEQVRRVGVCAGVGAGLWTYGLVMDLVVRPLTVGSIASAVTVPTELAAIALSVLLFIYVRFAPATPRVKVDAGLVYLVVNAMAVALLNSWAKAPPGNGVYLSWNTVVVLVGSMILPTTPGRMLVTSMVAASMDPLGVWLAHLRGMATPSAVNTLVLFMPNYACAVVSMLPSHVLQRIGGRLQQAREMGSYHLVERLGRGGMGEVWRGTHRLLKRDAAIKIIRPELLGAGNQADTGSMLRRFEREAQATAALSSPHTIRVFDFGVTADQSFYYVMELLAGRDLESLVREFGPVPASRVVFLLRQACHSLAEAHARGLVHRDVTPANIYVCRMGLDFDFVKVLDFGLVKSSGRRSLSHTRATGTHDTATGTPAFMAPEVITNGGEVDQRADVYALGCVAYYLLTGSLVFEADTPMRMFMDHLQTAPIPPSQRTEMPIPREVDELVLACLAKDPADRPQDVDQVMRLLARCASAGAWDGGSARKWWEKHLPELTRPASDDTETTAVAGFRAA